jgi:hypothetical protein
MARYGHRKIVWKDDAKRASAQQTVPKLVPEHPLDREPFDLQVGDMFLTAVHLEVREFLPSVKPHAFKYVIETWLASQQAAIASGYPSKVFSRDSIAIYAGTHRVEEADARGNVVSRLRHTFIINGARYMTNNLNNFKQV